MTVKDLKGYLDNFKETDLIRVVASYNDGKEVRLMDVNLFGAIKPGKYNYPILLMRIKDAEDEEAVE